MLLLQKKDGAEGTSKSKLRSGGGASGLGLLPPPPGSTKLPAPPGSSPATSPAHVVKSDNAADSWGEFASAQSR